MADDDKVGFRKPPKRTRFRKGQSGNPKGRPKGGRNVATVLRAVLEERIVVREGGQPRRVSTQEALIRVQRAKALSGNVRAFALILGLMARYLPDDDAEGERVLGPDDRTILEQFAPRVLKYLQQESKNGHKK